MTQRTIRKVCRAVIILAAVLIYCWVGRLESFRCSISEGVIVICALLAVALGAWGIGIKEDYR